MPKRKVTVDKTKDGNLDKFLGITKKSKSDIDKNWIITDDLLIYNPSDIKGNCKVASFDLDYTLIMPKSGKKWPKSWDDWKFLFPEVPVKLKKENSTGSKIVIFTNQGGVEKGNTSVDDVIKKFNAIRESLGFEFQVFASLKYYSSIYRKPCIGMFDLLEEKYNESVKIDKSQSCYIGDAAGRPSNWAAGKKKDFNANDRYFALNACLEFQTPEEYFLGWKQFTDYPPPAMTPLSSSQLTITQITEPAPQKPVTYHQFIDAFPAGFVHSTLVLMIGPPGSGKSTFVKNYLKNIGFKVVSRDILKTPEKCLSEVDKCLQARSNVVVDNTNPDINSRQAYIQLGKKHKASAIIGLMLDVNFERALHNEMFRRLTNDDHQPINQMVYNIYKSKFKPPQLSEGFTALYKVLPDLKFQDDAQKSLYSLYLT